MLDRKQSNTGQLKCSCYNSGEIVKFHPFNPFSQQLLSVVLVIELTAILNSAYSD